MASQGMRNMNPSMETLPDEVLLQILMHLTYPELLRVSRVCRRWRNLSRDSLIIRQIDIRSIPITAQTLTSFCRERGPKLVYRPNDVRSLQIKGRNQSHLSVATMSKFTSKFQELEILHLEDFTFPRIKTINSVLFPENLDKLTCKHISSARGWFSTYVELQPGRNTFQNLTHLDLSNSSFVCVADIEAFKSSARSLRHINVNGCYRLSALSSWIDNFPNLEVLLASRMRLAELPCLGLITDSLSRLKHLELRLAGNSDHNCPILIDRIACCGGGSVSLEILDIGDWMIDEARVNMIQTAFPKLKKFSYDIC